MANVRGVVVAFFGLVLLAAAVLVVGGIRSRGAAWYWRAVARGSAVLAIGAVVVGIAFALAFEQAFTLFHDLFFAPGTWSFDPATDRLVQLFPDAFWTETSVAIAIVGLLLTLATWAFARHRALGEA
jgi:integral membrane protein (TIGR01906 family)